MDAGSRKSCGPDPALNSIPGPFLLAPFPFITLFHKAWQMPESDWGRHWRLRIKRAFCRGTNANTVTPFEQKMLTEDGSPICKRRRRLLQELCRLAVGDGERKDKRLPCLQAPVSLGALP